MFLSVWKCNLAGASKAWLRDVQSHHEVPRQRGSALQMPRGRRQRAQAGSGTSSAHTQIPEKEGKLNSTPNGQDEPSTNTCMPLLGSRGRGRGGRVYKCPQPEAGLPAREPPLGWSQSQSRSLLVRKQETSEYLPLRAVVRLISHDAPDKLGTEPGSNDGTPHRGACASTTGTSEAGGCP